MQYPKDFPRVELTHIDAAAINTMVQLVQNSPRGTYRLTGDVLVLKEAGMTIVARLESVAYITEEDSGETGGECP